jgi:hypothetical protein
VAINTWWEGDPAQRFWMQIADRDHLAGVLQSPKLPASKVMTSSARYSLAILGHHRVLSVDRRDRGGWMASPRQAQINWVSRLVRPLSAITQHMATTTSAITMARTYPPVLAMAAGTASRPPAAAARRATVAARFTGAPSGAAWRAPPCAEAQRT